MLFFDTETYSELDIFKVGGDKYTRNCEVMLAGYAFGDEPAKVVDLTNDESLEEVLTKLRPNTRTDERRVEIAKSHLKEIRRSVRRLQNEVTLLQEQLQVLEEAKGNNE